jgi:hypothetical protein
MLSVTNIDGGKGISGTSGCGWSATISSCARSIGTICSLSNGILAFPKFPRSSEMLKESERFVSGVDSKVRAFVVIVPDV